MKRLSMLLACSLALSMASGCASSGPDLPKYVAPNIAPSKAATVKGTNGTYIITVDNTAVPGTFFRSYDAGGNEVVLTPGRHRVVVERLTSNGAFSHGTSANYECDFEAGHVYEVGRASFFSIGTKMTDTTTDVEIEPK